VTTTTELRKLAAIMFTDMVGYSALSQRDEKLALELLEEHRQLLREIFPRFNGTEIKTIGDAFLVEFNSALEAAQCAIEIQRTLAKRNHDVTAERRIELKIGIHIGDVVHRGGDVYGDGVNIASRIEPLAGAGGICISMDVERQIRNAVETRFEKLAPTELKNISVQMELFRIVLPWERQAAPAVKSEIRSPKSETRSWIWSATAVVLLLIIGIGWWWISRKPLPERGQSVSGSSLPIPEKSIAVLPFENLSDDKSNAYFAEGIQDEILTRLSKIAALKVISRTSTQKYKSAPENLREIGNQLGVSNLLEGSVQKSGNAVHVNVQLIRAATDEHVWAESYNRKLDDVFGVEGEVATAIADQLNARLSLSEQKAVTAKPTQNTAAYDAYLRGVAFQGRVDDLRTNWVKSAEAFAEAVRLDPDFAVGWAQLSRQESLVYNSVNRSLDHQAAARKALDNAMKLGPDLVETKIAQGWYHSYIEADYDGARASLEQVRRQYPNNSTVSELLAAVLRRQGHWEESRRLFDQTVELDPRNVFLLANAALAGLETRDPAYTQKYMRRALDLSPQNATLVAQLAASYQMSGDIKQAQTVLDSVQPRAGDSFYFSILAGNAILLRNYQPAIATFQSHLKNLQVSDSYFPNYENYLADLQRHSGDIAAATTSYRKAKADAEKQLRSQPDNADLLDTLAWSETWLGDKSAALKHAQEAVVLMPASKEPRIGPSYEDTLARIQAQVGEKDAAITALQHLLVTSYSAPVVTPALLRLDPDWDNLRGDPRFENLCEEPKK
jgi:TolB-like protein/class 3 adenylate cyclase/Flp pilus assembly protein TadD